ncbi:hypothetical protein MD484_g6315, partial [Candolleomyces efflorescens]
MGGLRDMVGYKPGRPDARRAGRNTGPDGRHFHIKDVLVQMVVYEGFDHRTPTES